MYLWELGKVSRGRIHFTQSIIDPWICFRYYNFNGVRRISRSDSSEAAGAAEYNFTQRRQGAKKYKGTTRRRRGRGEAKNNSF